MRLVVKIPSFSLQFDTETNTIGTKSVDKESKSDILKLTQKDNLRKID